MGVVLSEAANTEQAVESAGQFMAVNKAQFCHAQGQVTVGMGLSLIYKHSAGAVHGLYGVIHIVNDGGVHIVLVVIPVTAPVPEVLIQDNGGGYLHIAVALMYFMPVIKQGVAEHHALGQEEGEAGTLFHEGKQAKLLAQLAVVALLGFLYAGNVFIKVGFLFEGSAVYALEHLVLFASPPVCACNAHELNELYLAGGLNVRAGAKVNKVALLVKADDGVFGQIFYELHLIGFILFLEHTNSLLKGQGFGDYLFHLFFDLNEIFRSERFCVKVVIEAVFNGRAYGKFCLGMHTFYGLCEDMGAGVAHCPAAVGVIKGEQLKAVVAVNGAKSVRTLTVYLCGKGGLSQAGADGFGYLQGGHAVLKLLNGAIGKGNVHGFPPCEI